MKKKHTSETNLVELALFLFTNWQRCVNKLFSIEACQFANSCSFCNRKSANFLCASPQITNLLIFKINPQIANPQISIKYCTTLSQTRIICYHMLYSYREKVSIYGLVDILNPQIENTQNRIRNSLKDWVRKSQIR
jgi:hypothetical protein